MSRTRGSSPWAWRGSSKTWATMWQRRRTPARRPLRSSRRPVPTWCLWTSSFPGKLDGIETAQKIAAVSSTPVVYLTSYADDRTFGRAALTGPSGYILKPVEKKQLHITIELALNRQGIELGLREDHARIYASMKGVISAIAETVESRVWMPRATTSVYRNWRLPSPGRWALRISGWRR